MSEDLCPICFQNWAQGHAPGCPKGAEEDADSDDGWNDKDDLDEEDEDENS